jgi:hypothetical protein
MTVMSSSTGTQDRRHLPTDGDVANCVFLHLDTVARMDKHALHGGEWLYEVAGKPRPMLILQRRAKQYRGRTWFLALPITTKGRDEKGQVREGMQWIGKCLDGQQDSYVRMEVREIPDNLLHYERGGSALVSPCDYCAFQNAVRVIMHKALHGQLARKGIHGLGSDDGND